MKYIDAEKLIAEIERRREICADIAADERNEEVAEYYRGKEVAHDEISSLITSLQQEQPEVDLEKEYKEYVEDDPVFSKLTNRNAGLVIARHFYELGKIARKEE